MMELEAWILIAICAVVFIIAAVYDFWVWR